MGIRRSTSLAKHDRLPWQPFPRLPKHEIDRICCLLLIYGSSFGFSIFMMSNTIRHVSRRQISLKHIRFGRSFVDSSLPLLLLNCGSFRLFGSGTSCSINRWNLGSSLPLLLLNCGSFRLFGSGTSCSISRWNLGSRVGFLTNDS